MFRSKPRRSRIRLLAAERAERERRVAARTSTQQDAYRAEIILRVASGQTDVAIAHDMGLAERTVFLWRRRFAEHRLDGLKDSPQMSAPPFVRCRRPGSPPGAGLPETRRGRSDARWADPLEYQGPGAIRNCPPRTGSGSSQ